MFSERLERLIEAALQDGVLTDQEKAAIIKRAQAEGEDIDEVDIYIQSLQQKRQQELNEKAQKAATEEMVAQKKAREAASKARQEEEKERAKLLRKCPACGEPIPFGTSTCPNCGHVIELDDKHKEILDLIKDIERCKPTSISHDYKLDITACFPKKEFDKDPDLQRVYTIIGDSDDDDKYQCESRYSILMKEAEWKYRGNSQLSAFLRDERKRTMKLYMNKITEYASYSSYADAKNVLSVLEVEYADELPENYVATKRKELEEKHQRSIKQHNDLLKRGEQIRAEKAARAAAASGGKVEKQLPYTKIRYYAAVSIVLGILLCSVFDDFWAWIGGAGLILAGIYGILISFGLMKELFE